MKLNRLNFSLEDIKIASVMPREEYLDTEHKRNAVSKHYSYRKNNAIEKMVLFDEYSGRSYAARYFLQDIAFTYRSITKNKDDLLLFIEKFEEKEFDKYKIFAISTYDCFNDNLYVEFEFTLNHQDGISSRDVKKIENILNNGDFVNDRVVIVSNSKVEFIDEIISKSALRLKSDHIVYLDKREITALFLKVTLFKKSNSLRNFVIVNIIVLVVGLGLTNTLFDSGGYMKQTHENTLFSKEEKVSHIKSEIEKLKIKQERLFLDTTNYMIKFDPKTMDL